MKFAKPEAYPEVSDGGESKGPGNKSDGQISGGFLKNFLMKSKKGINIVVSTNRADIEWPLDISNTIIQIIQEDSAVMK